MSEVKVNKLSPRSGTTVTLGDSGDTITIPSGVTFDASSGGLAGTLTTAAQPNITSVGTLTSFTSTGIDDNATSTAITIDSSENVALAGDITTGNNGSLFLLDNAGQKSGQITTDNSTSNSLQIDADPDNSASDSYTAFRIDNSEKVRIDSSGNVGIGTSSPANLLHLTPSQNSTALQIANTSDTNGIRINSGVSGLVSNSLQFLNVSGDSLLIIDGTNKSTIVGNIGPSGYRASFGDFEVKNQDGANNPGGTLVLSNTDGSILSGQQLGNLTFASYDQSGATTTGGVASIRAIASETYGSTSGANLLFYTHPSSANNGTVDGNMSERMRIDSSGNVGIGTTNTSPRLYVVSNSNENGMILDCVGTPSNYHFDVRNDNSSIFRIDSSGKVGIGTTSPISPLTVNSGSNNVGLFYGNTGNNYIEISDNNNTNKVSFGSMSGGNAYLYSGSGKYTALYSGASERMRIDSSGNVGIGLTSPTRTFEVQRNVSSDYITSFQQLNSGGYILELDYPSNSPDNNSVAFLVARDSTTNRCIIWSDGDIQNHDGTYGTLSDERIKQNITDANSQWNDIKSLQFKNFKKKDDVIEKGEANAPTHLGVIAQELEQTSPGLVAEYACSETDASLHSDFTDWENATVKGVKYSILYMKAVKALQEAMERIETLETKVQTLENNQP